MLKLSDLTIDPKSLGEKMLLVGVDPYYEYKNGVRTNNLEGYKYEVALPAKKMDKIVVKIAGNHTPLELSEESMNVKFTDLEVIAYTTPNGVGITAKATAVTPVNTTK